MDKKLLWVTVALVLVIAALIGMSFVIRSKQPADTSATETTGDPTGTESSGNTESSESAKSFTLVTVHKDGSKKEQTLETEETYLGAALVKAGLVEAEENRFGLRVRTADGEKAVFEEDSAYWAVCVGETPADKATDLLIVEAGQTYQLVYTQPAPLTSADDAGTHLFYNVFLPIARGHIGTAWKEAKAFAEYMGYEAVIDEGVYHIGAPGNDAVWFGGYLTSVGGATLVSATYHVYTDGVDYFRSGVRGRYRNAEDPINNRENPVYFTNENVYTGLSAPVDSLTEVEACLVERGTLKQKAFWVVLQDTFGKPTNTYWVVTPEENVCKALEYAGFITIGEGSDGSYIYRVQGVTPAAGAQWLLWKGSSYKSLPIDTTLVENGATYTVAYKRIH